MDLHINNRFSQLLPADVNEANTRRQVQEACFSWVRPQKTAAPKMLHTSISAAKCIGLSQEDLNSQEFLQIFTGNEVFTNSRPYAMCYGGHQFGHWAGQLGDGRAINLAEVEHQGQSWALQLKGAGPTPYSRSADGLAVLRSSIREYICSEAMHYLGVPSTRALSLATTGDEVLRDMMYDGNAAYEKGAVVCRMSPSFIRFGNFEIFAARQDKERLQQLLDFTIKQHYPHLGAPSQEVYLAFFQEVADRTMEMILAWQRVGFVHGVMNTDNFSILGLSIDYGPYGWLEGYDNNWTPNTTDRRNRRYRFGNQANISLWNLVQLANALVLLINDDKALEAILLNYQKTYPEKEFQMMLEKLGLQTALDGDTQLVIDLDKNLHRTETDMTIFYRLLANLKRENSQEAFNDQEDDWKVCAPAFYNINALQGNILKEWQDWFLRYKTRLQKETRTDKERKASMNLVNPKYVFRNYMAQLAIDAADKGDNRLLEEFMQLLAHPYSEQSNKEEWFAKRPEWARHKAGCSMLSCSS